MLKIGSKVAQLYGAQFQIENPIGFLFKHFYAKSSLGLAHEERSEVKSMFRSKKCSSEVPLSNKKKKSQKSSKQR